ncbi:MAG: arginine--tRNA ligase [Patescibacteria group bacterium]|nr:arginine--tRNA ligase [Patescibacteria group bacterium]MDE2015101.1 arginine--tRNA ligase [Patescibacteria group bacterium]MDE2226529.1 arginine--tRNA ligase [Patescibacteria group bacterium]
MKDKIIKILSEFSDGRDFSVTVPEQENFGHYSTNLAMVLAKREKKNPLELARELVQKISAAAPAGFFQKVEAAAPGFINFWFSPEALQNELAMVTKNIKKYGERSIGKSKTVIVEYSQPNIAKMMHVGHLRTTIIGAALANVFESLGYKVIRWNYLGDWGTQFGKLIAAYKMWGDKKKIEEKPIEELQKLYVRFHDEMKSRPGLELEGQEEFKKLEEGDKENRKLWQWFKKESLKEFERTYKELGVEFDEWKGESFFEKDMKPLVSRLVQDGVAVKSEGAIVIKLDKFNLPPALIEKADGASLYLTRDIANIEYRVKKYKPEKILYVVGNEQSLHFEQLFAITNILGLADGVELKHVKYGLVLGESGQKLATREGRTILLKEVLGKAIKLAREIVEEKNKELSAKEKDKIAEAVAVGALKYNDLREGRTTDIVFDWKRMLDFSGDSGPYLQYTYARLKSILRKSQALKPKSKNFTLLNSDVELALARKIFEFPDEVARSGETLQTSNLANYLYKLAVLANRLYETTPVLKEESASRRSALLGLINITAKIIEKGLNLLGITAIDRI